MATVLINDIETALHFARSTRLGDKYVLPRNCTTAHVVHEFLCLQDPDTVFTVNEIYRFKIRSGWFFVKKDGFLHFNKDHHASKVFGNPDDHVVPYAFTIEFTKDENPWGGRPNALIKDKNSVSAVQENPAVGADFETERDGGHPHGRVLPDSEHGGGIVVKEEQGEAMVSERPSESKHPVIPEGSEEEFKAEPVE